MPSFIGHRHPSAQRVSQRDLHGIGGHSRSHLARLVSAHPVGHKQKRADLAVRRGELTAVAGVLIHLAHHADMGAGRHRQTQMGRWMRFRLHIGAHGRATGHAVAGTAAVAPPADGAGQGSHSGRGEARGDPHRLAASHQLLREAVENVRQLRDRGGSLLAGHALRLIKALTPVEHARLNHRQQLAQAQAVCRDTQVPTSRQHDLIRDTVVGGGSTAARAEPHPGRQRCAACRACLRARCGQQCLRTQRITLAVGRQTAPRGCTPGCNLGGPVLSKGGIDWGQPNYSIGAA